MRIYFSATGAFLEEWTEEIRELVKAGKKVVLISEDNKELFPKTKNYVTVSYNTVYRSISESRRKRNSGQIKSVLL